MNSITRHPSTATNMLSRVSALAMILSVALFMLLPANGFNLGSMQRREAFLMHTSLQALNGETNRRTATVGILSGLTFIVQHQVEPVFAEEGGALDDLSMPSESELEAQREAEAQARIKRKMELQKQASKAKSLNFRESLEGEKEKQKSLKKTQAEKRAAMCEELGRGC